MSTFAVRQTKDGIWYTASTWGTSKLAHDEADRLRRLFGHKEAHAKPSKQVIAEEEARRAAAREQR
jgi:hypothetical protein